MINCLIKIDDRYLEWSDVTLRPSTKLLTREEMRQYQLRVHWFDEYSPAFDAWFEQQLNTAVTDQKEIEELIKFALDDNNQPLTYEKLVELSKPNE